jgi:hypothetical protein
MKKIIDELINHSIKGVDVYRWKDATWLIFTDETRWVVELTDEGTLWYNYKFFKDVFKYVSLECGNESDGYITQWANEYFFNRINKTDGSELEVDWYTREVMNKGVKKSEERGKDNGNEFEWYIRAVIDKGVKEVLQSSIVESNSEVGGEVIEKGIKEINDSSSIHRKMRAENLVPRIIKDGIKNTYPDMIPGDYNWQDEFDGDKVIKCGVKL